MKIAQKYSHLNGEEYILVHKKKLYEEIISTIESIDAEEYMTKISKEKILLYLRLKWLINIVSV